MKLAIQEDMLPGGSPRERFARAADLGFVGVEVWGYDLDARIPALRAAARETGVAIAAVNHGNQGCLLSPDTAEREMALTQLRASIVAAVDLGAAGVVLAPHFGAPVLPDLSPYMSAGRLEAELLHAHLRSLSDFAYALGTQVFLEPLNRYETHFFNRLEDMARVTRRLKHPDVRITADVFHMALEEIDPPAALIAHGDQVGYVHVADSNRRLPGRGMTDFAAIAAALQQIGYTGWVSLECGSPGANAPAADAIAEALPTAVAHLRAAGLGW